MPHIKSYASLCCLPSISPLAHLTHLSQVIYILGVTWNCIEEVRELRHWKHTTGSHLSYFKQLWNWVDMASLTLQWVGVALW